MYRLKQVLAAIFGNLSAGDWAWIKAHLDEREWKLFAQLDPVDQYHSFQVARTGIQLAKQWGQAVDEQLVIKAGLLHDLGKMGIKLNLWQRILPVVLTRLLPELSSRLGRTASYRGYWRGIVLYWKHGIRGGEIAAAANLDRQIVEVIVKHQEQPAHDDSPILKIVKMADSMH